MKISIASDHAGFDEKELLKSHLIAAGHEVVDRGPGDDAKFVDRKSVV